MKVHIEGASGWRDGLELEKFFDDSGFSTIDLRNMTPRHFHLIMEGMRAFVAVLPKGHTDRADAQGLLDTLKELTKE